MASSSSELATAAAQGDLAGVRRHLTNGADINALSRDGMTPLSVASFWGYSDIVACLLEHGADPNVANKGTEWTALHCAAFQGHGPVLHKLLRAPRQPDLTATDVKGRTAADFASALDAIWPLFEAKGCKRTSKSELIRLDVVQKIRDTSSSSYASGDVMTSPSGEPLAHFSRPGSAYVLRAQNPSGPVRRDPKMEVAAVTGDVLASLQEEPTYYEASRRNPSLMVLDN